MSPFQPMVVRGFFEINTHDDFHLAGKSWRNAFSLVAYPVRFFVMDRAGADDHEAGAGLPAAKCG